jgi:hypothetical protein
VATAEVVEKARISATSLESVTRKEKIGGAKKYAKQPTAMKETTADERKLPWWDNRTTTTRLTHCRSEIEPQSEVDKGQQCDSNAVEQTLNDCTPSMQGHSLSHLALVERVLSKSLIAEHDSAVASVPKRGFGKELY